MALGDTLRLFAALLGAGLSLFLGIVLRGQRTLSPAGALVWRIVVLLGVFNALMTLSYFKALAMGRPQAQSGPLTAAAMMAWLLAMLAAIWLQILAVRAGHRKFAWGFALALALAAAPPLISLRFVDTFSTTMAAPLTLAWFLFWEHPFGLQLSRRALLALLMGVSAAVYLYAGRAIAWLVQERFQNLGWLVEFALLFWAGVLWLPLYAWMNRMLMGRARLYWEFGRTVIEQAALILDFAKRKEFLARELCARLQLRRVILLEACDAEKREAAQMSEPDCRMLMGFARQQRAPLIAAARVSDPEVRQALRRLDYNYLLPLNYENRLLGVLLIDSRPLLSLEENEEVLAGLAPQISLSLEAGRHVEARIALERELARQDHLAKLGAMSATIAHEVKNPLSAIKTTAQFMLEDASIAGRYRQDLELIVRETDRLDLAVRQLLGFSRPAPPLDEDVDLSALVRDTAAALASQARTAQVAIDVEAESPLVLRRANNDLLRQIVWNLLLNALEASPTASRVRITARREGSGTIRLAVCDQGPGIPEHLRESVFEPFFTTKTKGSGLGLAIVRKGARILGGDVRIECPAGGGTEIIVLLPEDRA